MKRAVKIAGLILLALGLPAFVWSVRRTPVGIGFRIPSVFAQAIYQQKCPAPFIPITGIGWQVSNLTNDQLLQWGCLDNVGNMMTGNSFYLGNGNEIDAAVKELPVTGGTLYIPQGTFAISSSVTSLTDNQHIECQRGAVINFKGSTTAIFDIGTANDGTANHFNISVRNCRINGNSGVTYGIRLRGIHHSDFSGNNIRNVTTAGLITSFAVLDTFDDIRTSVNDGAFTTQPQNCMILDGPDANHKTTAGTIRTPICEGISGTGIVFNNTSSIELIAGTSEQNNKGITLSSGAVGNSIFGIDVESNAVSNIEDGGFQNSIISPVGNGLITILATAQNALLSGREFDSITITAGAVDTRLSEISWNNSGSGVLTDNGTSTIYSGVKKILGNYSADTPPPILFANLGTPANGRIFYCSDCTIANPCAGAGTGAIAKRLNGVWVCN